MQLDKLDIGIVTLLREDGRVTVRQLASSLEAVNPVAVRRPRLSGHIIDL